MNSNLLYSTEYYIVIMNRLFVFIENLFIFLAFYWFLHPSTFIVIVTFCYTWSNFSDNGLHEKYVRFGSSMENKNSKRYIGVWNSILLYTICVCRIKFSMDVSMIKYSFYLVCNKYVYASQYSLVSISFCGFNFQTERGIRDISLWSPNISQDSVVMMCWRVLFACRSSHHYGILKIK